MAGYYARHTKMCMWVFSFIPQGNKKNQQSILNTFLFVSLEEDNIQQAYGIMDVFDTYIVGTLEIRNCPLI